MEVEYKQQLKELVIEFSEGKNEEYVLIIYSNIYLIFKKNVFNLHISFKTL